MTQQSTLKLTEQQQKAYLDHDWNRCPVCKSDEVRAQSLENGGNQVWQTIVCLNQSCKKVWQDIYTLTGIEEVGV